MAHVTDIPSKKTEKPNEAVNLSQFDSLGESNITF
jgi:hypothetical protein